MRAPALVDLVPGLAQLPGLLSGAYLLGLLAASRRPAAPLPESVGRAHFTVVVPAHDEEHVLGPTLESLLAVDYPRERFTVVVVADHCSDDTVRVARRHGVEVLERRDELEHGKGRALAWAFDRLPAPTDAVAVVDADCHVSANILRGYERRLLDGAAAMQVCYLTSNPEESSHAALRNGAYLLYCVVRPTGKERLGLSAGLVGTGMCFARETLERVPWRAFSLAEDREYHMELVAHGRTVRFVEEATVTSWMPPSRREGRGQQMRWDSGRLRLATHKSPALLLDGLRARRSASIDAALDPLIPPQALLAALNVAALVLAAVSRRRGPLAMATWAIGAQGLFVVLGLVSVGAPRSVWRGALDIPGFVAGRLWSFALMAIGRGPATWVRSTRPSS